MNLITNAKAKLIKYAPEITFTAGIIFMGAAVVSSTFSALKIETIMDEKDEIQKKIDDHPVDEKYSLKDKQDDVLKLKVRTFKNIGKAYLPTVMFTVLGSGLLIYSFTEMKRRYVAAVALYNGLSVAFQSYRERVRTKIGEEEETKLYLGEESREITTTNENGEETKELTSNIVGLSPYSIIFTELKPDGKKNLEFDPNRNFNLMFLKSRENIWNDKLEKRGHVFLNEVLDSLGLDHTKEGAQVGWIKGNGDDFIDFGLYLNERDSVKNYIKDQRLHQSSIVLDFNVDGIILDKI